MLNRLAEIFRTNNRFRTVFFIVLAMVPVLAFFIQLAIYAVNIPYNDDYDYILFFLNRYLAAPGWTEQFGQLAAFSNDHRIIIPKLIVLLDYTLFRQVDFRTLIFIGNISLLIMMVSVYLSFKSGKDKLMYFLPAAFLLFQPAFSENSVFAIASIGNFYVLAFGFLAVALLAQKENIHSGRFLTALALSVAAYLSMGYGILFLLTGLLLCLYRKEWVKSGIWLAISALIVFFYQTYGGKAGNTYNFLFDWGRIVNSILYFFAFIGSNFGLSSSSIYFSAMNPAVGLALKTAPVLTGMAITAYFLLITRKGYFRKNPAVFSLFLFLFLTALGASVARDNYGFDQALTSRYKIVSIFFIILTYLSLIEIFGEKARKRVFAIALIFAIVFSSTMYLFKQKPMKQHRQDLIQSMKNWEETGKGINPLGHPYAYANEIMKTSVGINIYTPPAWITNAGRRN